MQMCVIDRLRDNISCEINMHMDYVSVFAQGGRSLMSWTHGFWELQIVFKVINVYAGKNGRETPSQCLGLGTRQSVVADSYGVCTTFPLSHGRPPTISQIRFHTGGLVRVPRSPQGGDMLLAGSNGLS